MMMCTTNWTAKHMPTACVDSIAVPNTSRSLNSFEGMTTPSFID